MRITESLRWKVEKGKLTPPVDKVSEFRGIADVTGMDQLQESAELIPEAESTAKLQIEPLPSMGSDENFATDTLIVTKMLPGIFFRTQVHQMNEMQKAYISNQRRILYYGAKAYQQMSIAMWRDVK